MSSEYIIAAATIVIVVLFSTRIEKNTEKTLERLDRIEKQLAEKKGAK